jgi:hypothetical protein
MLALAGPASASWSSSGSGHGAAKARSMPGGNQPSVSGLLTTKTVTWSASLFADGGAVPSYVIRRYPALGGAAQNAANGCGGLVAGTSCVETGVVGSWKYTVTPAVGLWRGAESAQG